MSTTDIGRIRQEVEVEMGIGSGDGFMTEEELTRQRAEKKAQIKKLRDQYRASSARRKQRQAELERDRKLLETDRLLAFVAETGGAEEIMRIPSPFRAGSVTPEAGATRHSSKTDSPARPTVVTTAREEIEMWGEKTNEKDRTLAKVLKQNQELRARVEELRKQQLGFDESVWDVVAPHKKKLYSDAVAEAKSMKDKIILKMGNEKIEEEKKHAAELKGMEEETRSMLNRVSRERLTYSTENERLETEVLRLRKAVSDGLRQKKALTNWETKHKARIEKIRRKFEMQMQKEMNAMIGESDSTNNAELDKARQEQWDKQQKELRSEAATLQKRLNAHMKTAVALNNEIVQLKKEIARVDPTFRSGSSASMRSRSRASNQDSASLAAAAAADSSARSGGSGTRSGGSGARGGSNANRGGGGGVKSSTSSAYGNGTASSKDKSSSGRSGATANSTSNNSPMGALASASGSSGSKDKSKDKQKDKDTSSGGSGSRNTPMGALASASAGSANASGKDKSKDKQKDKDKSSSSSSNNTPMGALASATAASSTTNSSASKDKSSANSPTKALATASSGSASKDKDKESSKDGGRSTTSRQTSQASVAVTVTASSTTDVQELERAEARSSASASVSTSAKGKSKDKDKDKS